MDDAAQPMSEANQICHIEIVTQNQEASQKFYGDLFGWKMNSHGGEYTLFNPPSGVSGGFTAPGSSLQSGTCIYIQVDDIEAKLKEIEEAGGEIVNPKTQISEDVGYFGMFKDPQGNLIGLLSSPH
ncbi:VOC family protein [bacterium]|nr:VOC family protein [bacterium]